MGRSSKFVRSVLLAGALIIFTVAMARGQSYTCAAGTSDNAIALRNYIVRIVTAPPSDTALTNTRDQYQLPAGSASSVTVEKKKPICDAAGPAFHRVIYPSDPPISRNLIVVKVGNSRYVVLDTSERAGEFEVHMVFDAAWQWITSFGA